MLRANQETAEEQKRREQLESTVFELKAQIEKDKKELVSSFSRNSFAFFSLPLLKHAAEVLNSSSDETESVPEMTSAAIDYILKRGICICGTHISKGSAAEQYLLKERRKQPPESIGALVRRYREQALEYIDSSETYYEVMKNRFLDFRKDQRELGLRLDECDAIDARLKGAKDVNFLDQSFQAAKNKVEEFDSKKNQTIEAIGACKKKSRTMKKSWRDFRRQALRILELRRISTMHRLSMTGWLRLIRREKIRLERNWRRRSMPTSLPCTMVPVQLRLMKSIV